MRSKDQNYRYERERRALNRAIRIVKRLNLFGKHWRVPTIEEIRRFPFVIAAKGDYICQDWDRAERRRQLHKMGG